MANPVDSVISGQALNSFGFDGIQKTISGLGLNTFGFLWPCDSIWIPSENPITTVWASATFFPANIESCLDP
jgi:hypothetical protein